MLEAFHGCDGVLVVVEGGQAEVILSIFSEACARGSDHLGVV